MPKEGWSLNTETELYSSWYHTNEQIIDKIGYFTEPYKTVPYVYDYI